MNMTLVTVQGDSDKDYTEFWIADEHLQSLFDSLKDLALRSMK